MNRKQLQIEVCKAMLDTNSRVSTSELNEHEIAVTTTGYDAFVFDKNEIIFDISKTRTMEVLKMVLADSDNDEIVKPTGEMFKDNGKIIEKLESENVETYVDVTFTKKYNGFQLMTNSSTNRILVKDEFGRLVGCFLPVRRAVKK